MPSQHYRLIHSTDGDPWERLQSAIIMQAFDDYVTYCKLATGRRRSKGDFTKEPRAELQEIRAYIVRVDDPETNALVKGLEAYCRKRHVRDVLRETA